MKAIPLSRGLFALVDDEDYELVSRYRWHASRGPNTHYARKQGRRYGGGRRLPGTSMHRMLMLADDSGLQVDHINRNGLDNRRANLRLVTVQENQWNQAPYPSRSGYRGVRWHSANQAWMALTTVGGQRITFGTYFPTSIEAALAYDDSIRRVHGAYAPLNFPDDSSRRCAEMQVDVIRDCLAFRTVVA